MGVAGRGQGADRILGWTFPHFLFGSVSSDELEEGRGAVSEGEPDPGDPKREVRSLAALPGLPLRLSLDCTQYLFLFSLCHPDL